MNDSEWDIPISDDLRFIPHHTYCDETEWIDAQLRNSSGRLVCEIDIGSTADKCCVNEDQRAAASVAWAAGTVYSYKPYSGSPLVLLVPDRLTRLNVKTALDRFRP